MWGRDKNFQVSMIFELFFQMEDDLNFFSNGIQPQRFSNGRQLEKDDLNLDLLMKDNLREIGRS